MAHQHPARPSAAVLFDAGGVLFHEHGGALFAPFERRYDVSSREFLAALDDSAAYGLLRTGQIEQPTYLNSVVAELTTRFGDPVLRPTAPPLNLSSTRASTSSIAPSLSTTTCSWEESSLTGSQRSASSL